MFALASASVSSTVEIFQVSTDDCLAALCLVPSVQATPSPKRQSYFTKKGRLVIGGKSRWPTHQNESQSASKQTLAAFTFRTCVYFWPGRIKTRTPPLTRHRPRFDASAIALHPSALSSACLRLSAFASRLPPKPQSEPSAAMTRWQGTSGANGLCRKACPTACAEPQPIRRASSP